MTARPRKAQGARLVELVEELRVELWHARGEGYATVETGGHVEHLTLRSRAFESWLSRQLYAIEKEIPRKESLREALAVLEGRATVDGEAHEVHTRVGAVFDMGAIYLDPCWPDWTVIEIHHALGWKLLSACESPVRFRRSPGMQPLPRPTSDGSLDDLLAVVNVADEDFPLLVAWLVGSLHPAGPYPIAAFQGEQGSAKTTTARFLRRILDPHEADLRSPPRDERDLAVTARNAWVTALDNVSYLGDWLSDGLCRLASGVGFAARALYTDRDEAFLAGARPIILTGIDGIVTRGDLLDRALLFECPRLGDGRRMTERQLRGRFDEVNAGVLGALLTAVSMALRNENAVDASPCSRMADFELWVRAAEPALPFMEGAFAAAYARNRQDADAVAVEASSVVEAVRAFMAERIGWEGRAEELLDKLEAPGRDRLRKAPDWPRKANGLGRALRRSAPALRSCGIVVRFERETGSSRGRIVVLEKLNGHASDSFGQLSDGSRAPANGRGNNDSDSSDSSDSLFF